MLPLVVRIGSFMKRLLLLALFAGLIVNAAKTRNIKFDPPKNFIKEANLFTKYIPTYYYSKEDKKVSLVIPFEIKVEKIPKTADGKINPDFIAGKQNFNAQFGIKDWTIHNFSFQPEKGSTKLEMIGSYKNPEGVVNFFVEHHYFSKSNQMQSIELLYPENSNPKAVQEAKASMDSFNPNFE